MLIISPVLCVQSLSEEVQSTLARLEALEDTCPEQGCRGDRVAAVAALWWQVSRLQQDVLDLSSQAGRRFAEWSDISKSVSEALGLQTTLHPAIRASLLYWCYDEQ